MSVRGWRLRARRSGFILRHCVDCPAAYVPVISSPHGASKENDDAAEGHTSVPTQRFPLGRGRTLQQIPYPVMRRALGKSGPVRIAGLELGRASDAVIMRPVNPRHRPLPQFIEVPWGDRPSCGSSPACWPTGPTRPTRKTPGCADGCRPLGSSRGARHPQRYSRRPVPQREHQAWGSGVAA